MSQIFQLLLSQIGPILPYVLCMIIIKTIAKRLRTKFIPSNLKKEGNKLVGETSRDVGWHRIPYEWTKIKDVSAIEKEKGAYLEVKRRAKTEEQKRCAFEFFIVKKKETQKTSPILKKLSDIFFIIGSITVALVFVIIVVFAFSLAGSLGSMGDPTAIKFGNIIKIVAFFDFVSYVLSILLAFLFKKSFKTSLTVEKTMSLREYEQLLARKIEMLNPYLRSLKILGLDESQIEEIKPVRLSGYLDEFISSDSSSYDQNITLTSYIKDKEKNIEKWVSSSNYISYWFFTDTQILVYSIQFDMVASIVDEITHEVFYEDICDIGVLVENCTSLDGSETILEKQYVIKLTTPNSTISFSVDADEHTLAVLQGLKQKIRENKQYSIT